MNNYKDYTEFIAKEKEDLIHSIRKDISAKIAKFCETTGVEYTDVDLSVNKHNHEPIRTEMGEIMLSSYSIDVELNIKL